MAADTETPRSRGMSCPKCQGNLVLWGFKGTGHSIAECEGCGRDWEILQTKGD